MNFKEMNKNYMEAQKAAAAQAAKIAAAQAAAADTTTDINYWIARTAAAAAKNAATEAFHNAEAALNLAKVLAKHTTDTRPDYEATVEALYKNTEAHKKDAQAAADLAEAVAFKAELNKNDSTKTAAERAEATQLNAAEAKAAAHQAVEAAAKARAAVAFLILQAQEVSTPEDWA